MARRILLLITDLQIGGTPTVVRELATRLAAIPHVKPEVASLADVGPVGHQLKTAGVPVTSFGARGPHQFLAVHSQLVDLIRYGRFDTVFSFLIHANFMAASASLFMRGVRFIQSVQTTQPDPAWHWKLQRVAWRRADVVVVPSPSVAEAAHERAGVPNDKLRVIPNATSLDAFRMHRNWIGSPPIPIGFIGRLDPVKRLPDLLAAVQQLGGMVHLNVFGDGPERARTKAEIGRLGIERSVTLHGAVPRPQEALRQIELLVLPSSAEGFGLVLIEAMAAGVPVVATQAPGIRDVVRSNETGLLVPIGAPQELASAIRMLLEDSALRRRLTMRALDDVRERFSWESVLKQYRELLDV